VRVTVLVSTGVVWALGVAAAWARAGDRVTVVLLDAATASARAGHDDEAALGTAMDAGVVVAAHDAALARRALAVVPGGGSGPDGTGLRSGVAVVDLDAVADLVTTGADKAVWL